MHEVNCRAVPSRVFFACLILDILPAALNCPQRFSLPVYIYYGRILSSCTQVSHHNQRQPKIDSVNCSLPAVTPSCSIWEKKRNYLSIKNGPKPQNLGQDSGQAGTDFVCGPILVLSLLMGHPTLCLYLFFWQINSPRDHLSLKKAQHVSST